METEKIFSEEITEELKEADCLKTENQNIDELGISQFFGQISTIVCC